MRRITAIALLLCLLAVVPTSAATEVDRWLIAYCGGTGADYDAERGSCVVIDTNYGVRLCEEYLPGGECYESAKDLVGNAARGS